MDPQEELARNSVRYGVKVAALTTKALAVGVAKLLKKLIIKEPTGRRTMQQMINNGGKLLAEELKGADVAELARIAKRYAVSFSAIKNEGTKDYTIFFKAANDNQIRAALTAYNTRALTREQEKTKLSQQGDVQPDKTVNKDIPHEEKKTEQVVPPPEQSQSKVPREERSPFEPERQTRKSKHPPRRSIPKELESAKEESRVIQEARAAEKALAATKGRGKEKVR